MANLEKYEMETVVIYNAAEQTTTVYMRNKLVMRRLNRLEADYPDTYKLLSNLIFLKKYIDMVSKRIYNTITDTVSEYF